MWSYGVPAQPRRRVGETRASCAGSAGWPAWRRWLAGTLVTGRREAAQLTADEGEGDELGQRGEQIVTRRTAGAAV
eukprot:scaffold8033_cov114-Isochrysis_galbana.AAC.3